MMTGEQWANANAYRVIEAYFDERSRLTSRFADEDARQFGALLAVAAIGYEAGRAEQ